MVSAAPLITALAGAFIAVQAAPALEARESVTPLTATQIASFKPYTNYAGAAYCNPSNTLAWNCGARCSANSAFTPIASGGDGGSVQFWYVGYDPNLNTVIIGYQGTDTSNLLSVLTDVDFFLEAPSTTLFPGVPSGVEVHNGFAAAHARSASDVLQATQTTLSRFGASYVTVVGHSLGGALALLGSLSLQLTLGPSVSVKAITYGMPRVGNPAFSDFYDAHVTATRITNKKDPVPILPDRELGFEHTETEVHINTAGPWFQCPGQDNTASQCTIGEVPNSIAGNVSDHDGPYDGVLTTC